MVAMEGQLLHRVLPLTFNIIYIYITYVIQEPSISVVQLRRLYEDFIAVFLIQTCMN